jgi:hypothetical protein
MRSKFRAAFVLPFIFVGCAPPPPGQFTGSHSFAELASLLAPIEAAAELKLYEGLPHQTMESDLFQKEIARTETIERAGSRYYAEPVAVDQATSDKLRELTSETRSFTERPVGIAKACGGYHPDWRLEWKQGKKAVAMELCFGCNDMKLYRNDELLIATEIHDPQSLEKLLNPLRTNRPTREASRP